jgi:hypothetical protein
MSTIMSKPGINDFHNSNFRVTLGDFPGAQASDMSIFHNFVKSVSLPGFSLATTTTSHFGVDELHNMGSRDNNDLGDLSIVFKLSEGLLNYFYIANYIQSVRHKANISKPGQEKQKDNIITSIAVDLLNNQEKAIARIHYFRCVPTSIDGLSLDYAQTGVLTFTTSFKFEEMTFELL